MSGARGRPAARAASRACRESGVRGYPAAGVGSAQTPALRKRVLAALLVSAAAVLLAGCGGSRLHVPEATKLPLVPGSRVVERLRSCNRGANAYCAIDMVVENARYPSPPALTQAERVLLRRAGWTVEYADVPAEYALLSPGARLHVTLAPVDHELRAIDLGQVQRPRAFTLALSRALFAHRIAFAVVLELGPS